MPSHWILPVVMLCQVSWSVHEDESPSAPEARLDRLVELMRQGIVTREPNTSVIHRAGRQSLFDGSYDWHSCVMAHWALLNVARVEQRSELKTYLLERLSADVLSRERAMLASLEKPPFLFPYDQAWLAMLLGELDHHAQVDDAILHPFREEIEERLFEWLVNSPFPEGVPPPDKGGKAFCGFYHSWLFTWLLLCWSDPHTPRLTDHLDQLFEERVEPHREQIAAHDDPHPFDFLWVPAVLALMDDARGDRERAAAYSGQPAALPESVKLSTVHVFGMELCRTWPDAAGAHAQDARARGRYTQRMAEYMGREDLWAQDFTVVTHWIPQYVWIGVWLERGRP